MHPVGADHYPGTFLERGPGPVVSADPTQMLQLLQNLIANAIRHRSERPPEVRVEAGEEEAGWVVSVRDNGIGIPPAHREQVFELFRRLNRPAGGEGNGVGLAVCKRIVERHGGRIWVESEPGRGSVFRFFLPSPGGSRGGLRGSSVDLL